MFVYFCSTYKSFSIDIINFINKNELKIIYVRNKKNKNKVK